jgi:bacteriocin biosynthesis cyclodehydratase domain-containing protein
MSTAATNGGTSTPAYRQTSAGVPADARVRLRKRTRRLLLDRRVLLAQRDRVVRLEPYGVVLRDVLARIAAGTSRVDLIDAVGRVAGAEGAALAALTFDRLADAGMLERLDLAVDLPAVELARFDRLLNYLSEQERPGMSRFDLLARLRSTRVAVIGTGGLGSWIIYNLLCCAVGRLTLIDGDRVELSNLNRSILYTEQQVGVAKVEAARRSALRFAPRAEVTARCMAVESPEQLTSEIIDHDLVIATADEPAWLVRAWVAEACHRARVPLLHPTGLQVGPFYLPCQSSCPMCDWAHMVDRNPRQAELLPLQRQLPKGDPGAVSFVGTVTAGMVMMEVFRYLTGERPRTVGGVWDMDAQLRAGVRPLPRHPGCAVCGTREPRYRLDAIEPVVTPPSGVALP